MELVAHKCNDPHWIRTNAASNFSDLYYTKSYSKNETRNQSGLQKDCRPACTIFELIPYEFKAFSQHSGLKANDLPYIIINLDLKAIKF